MQQYTSEEALNGILNIIQTVVNEHTEAQNKKPNDYQQVGDLVTALLGGVAAGSSKDVNLGTQIKDLATGMTMLKDKGITDNDAKTVAGMISTLGESIKSLEFSEVNISSVQSIAQTLVMLGSIDPKLIDRINRLSNIDTDGIDKLKEFLHKLNFSVSGEIDEKSLKRDIGVITSLLKSITDIIDGSHFRFSTMFAPARGKLMGKAVANFFKALIEAIPEKQLKIDIKGIAELMNGLLPLIKKDSEYSVWRMKMILSKKNGERIGAFFAAIVKDLPDSKEAAKSINGIANLIKVLSDISLFDLLSIKLMGSILNEKLAGSINKFVNKLIDSFDDSKMKRVKTFGHTVKDLTSSVLLLTAGVLVMAAGLALFGFLKILESVAVITAFTGAMLFIFRLIAKHADDILKAEKGILKTALVISLMTLNVVVVALLAEKARRIKWESLGKVATIYAFLGVLATAMIFVGNKWQKGGKNALIGMVGLAACMIIASIAIGIVVDIAQHHSGEDLVIGMGMLLVTTGFMIGMLFLLKMVSTKDLLWGTLAMVGMSAVLIVTAIALGLIVEVAAKHKIEDVLLGMGVLLVTELALVGMVMLLKLVSAKDLLWGVLALAGMVAITIGIALVIAELFIPIALHGAEAGIGAGIVILTILALELELLLLKAIKANDLIYGVAVLAVLAFLTVGISLMIKELFIPIGKQKEAALYGLVAVGAIITAMTAVMYVLGKMTKSKEVQSALVRGAVVLAGVAVLLLILSGATLAFIKLTNETKGLTGEQVAITSAVMVGLIAGITSIAFAIGKLIQGKESIIGEGALVLAGAAAIIYLLSEATKPFIELAKMTQEVSVGDIVTAGIIEVALITAVTAIAVAIGLLMDATLGIGAAVIAEGLIAVAAIAGTIALMSEATEEFVDLAVKLSKYKAEDLLAGSLIMTGVITGATLIITEVATLGGVAALLGAISIPVLMHLITEVAEGADNFAQKLLEMKQLNGSDKWEGGTLEKASNVMIGVIDKMIDMIEEFYKIELQLTLFDIDNSIKASKQIEQVIDGYIDVVMKANESIQPSDISAFNNVIIGKGKDDKTAMIGCIIACIEALRSIELELFIFDIDSSIKASKQIIEVCSMFMDVVARIASLQYISGYENSKPIYSTLDPDDFGRAAEVVTKSFFDFVSKLKTGFDGISYWSTFTIDAITDSMKPLIDCISRFVDVVMKVATGLVLNGYDSQGKALYITMEPEMFTAAADAVTSSFLGFVSKLSENVKGMNDNVIDLIEDLGEALSPMMNSISAYVDAILKLATSTYTISLNGKQITKSVTPEMFMNAATKVSDSFMTFLTKLDAEIKNLDDDTAEIISDLGSGLGVMMQGVGSYVSAIMEMATGTYLVGYDKNGKGIYQHVTDRQINTAADAIVVKFKNFLTSMINFIEQSDIDEDSAHVVEELGKGVLPIMKSVTDFAKALMTIAAGSYQAGVDRRGNPIYKKLTNGLINAAATTIIKYYTYFVSKIMDLASRPSFQGQGAKAMQLLGKSIQPIMDSAVDFANMLIMFLKPLGTIKNAQGKTVSFRLDMKTIGSASKKIADAYMTFVNTLTSRIEANKSLQANIKKISQYMKDISNVVSLSAKSATQLSNLLTTMSKIKGLNDAANNTKNSLIVKFTNAISALADDIVKSAANYKVAQVQYKQALAMTNIALTVAKQMKSILDTLNSIKSLSKYKVLCSNFAGSITELAKIPRVIPNASTLIPFMSNVNAVAKLLQVLEGIMNNSEMTKACQKFIKDIEILTQQSLTKRVAASRRALGMFGTDLKVFTKQVVISDKVVIKFTNNMNKMSNSLTKFDDLLIKKEKQRNEAIKHMAELLERTAKAVSTLQKNIEALDENKILTNFKGISEMLELAKQKAAEITSSNTSNQTTTNNKTAAKPQTTNNRNVAGNTTVVNSRNTGKTMITMTFANTSITGFMETKNI